MGKRLSDLRVKAEDCYDPADYVLVHKDHLARLQSGAAQPAGDTIATPPASLSSNQCVSHATENRVRDTLPCPWCAIDELKQNRDSLQRQLNLRNEQIDGYERQLGIIDAGAECTIGSEIERLLAASRVETPAPHCPGCVPTMGAIHEPDCPITKDRHCRCGFTDSDGAEVAGERCPLHPKSTAEGQS